MVWIKFTRPYTVKNAAGRTYELGELVEVSPESARHFTSRFAAVEVPGPAPKVSKAKVRKLTEAEIEDES